MCYGGLQQADRVVECHRLDVERTQDGFFVDEVAVVTTRVASGQDDAHVTEVDVNGAQVRAIQRRTLQRNNKARFPLPQMTARVNGPS